MLRSIRDTQYNDRFDRIKGTKIFGSDGEKIGTVDDLLIDPEAPNTGYALVDSGGWLSSRRFVLPLDYLDWSDRDDSLLVPVTKQHIETLPEWDDRYIGTGDWSRYEDAYSTRWRSLGLKPRPTTGGHFWDRQSIRRTVTAGAQRPNAVYGVYTDQSRLEASVDRLKNEGFQSSDISVVFPDKRHSSQFAMEHSTKAPEGAMAGGGTGLVVGGVLGWLAGIGSLAIPGVGPLIAAGPIVAALAGAGVGSAVGGLAGALIGLGLPEIEAKRYEREVKEGRMLLSVRCEDPRFAASALTILKETGAKDIFEAGQRLAA
jgi:hypothetical protein